MHWAVSLFKDEQSIATSILVLAFVVAAGIGLGAIRFRGIRLGVAGVLFSGLLFGHLGLRINATVLEFAREFGLIIFVFTVGLAVGPGFFHALKAHGLRLNLLGAAIVALGVVVTLATSWLGGVSLPIAVGVFCGATTNTPSLAATTQTLRNHQLGEQQMVEALEQAGIAAERLPRQRMAQEVAKLSGLGYAVAYPFGVLGIILSMLLLRHLFRVDPVADAEAWEKVLAAEQPRLARVTLKVNNPNLDGRPIARIPALNSLEVTISRVFRNGEQHVAHADFRLALGDVLAAVGTPEDVQQLQDIVGEEVALDLPQLPSSIAVRWVVVTRSAVVGKRVNELALGKRFGVQITRIRRAEVELPPLANLSLGLGDRLHLVGTAEAIAAAAREVGDSPKKLEQPDLVPIFCGIALGVVLGSWPIPVPGMASPLKLGLAGGPLIVALLMSRFQRIGPMVIYLPRSSSYVLQEFGIALFLAAVGLRSGDRFLATLTQGDGLWWLGYGALITLLPLLLVGTVAHRWMSVRFTSLVGLLAGSMTDPPALAFANSQAQSELPAIAYATVYPTSMILRVLAAQLMTLWWLG